MAGDQRTVSAPATAISEPTSDILARRLDTMEAAARLNNTQADVTIRAQGKLLITGFNEMQRRQQVHGDTLQQAATSSEILAINRRLDAMETSSRVRLDAMETSSRVLAQHNTQASVAIRAQGQLIITGFNEMQRRQQVYGDTLQQTILAHMTNSGAQLTALLNHLNVVIQGGTQAGIGAPTPVGKLAVTGHETPLTSTGIPIAGPNFAQEAAADPAAAAFNRALGHMQQALTGSIFQGLPPVSGIMEITGDTTTPPAGHTEGNPQ
jgi:hypothetical protein